MKRWARFVSRTHWLWVIGWPVVALAVWWPAPRVSTLLEDDDKGFLPASMPSVQAQALLRREFPDHAPLATAAVIAFREPGLTERDRADLGTLSRRLAAQADRYDWTVRAAALQPYLRSILESGDQTAALVVVDLPAAPLTHSSVKRVRAIRETLSKIDLAPGLHVEITGNAALGELLDANAKRDVDLTTVWAFAAVMAILLVIYRSPIAMLLPVATIGVSVMLSLGLLGWSATWGLAVNGLVEMFIIVILVGSGVDYCLFLFSRLREHISEGLSIKVAVESALADSGGAILASAGTNAAALATMVLAGNRDLYTSGPTIALSIGIATFAVLTLTPSLLRIVGKQLFWPRRDGIPANDSSAAWSAIARFVVRRPLLGPLVTIALLAPFMWLGARAEPLFDALEEYPPDTSLVRGARRYQQAFFAADGVTEVSLLADLGQPLTTPEGIAHAKAFVDSLYDRVPHEFGLLFQRDLRDPLGRDRRKAAMPTTEQPTNLLNRMTQKIAQNTYIGRSGEVLRVDWAFRLPARSAEAMNALQELASIAQASLDEAGFPIPPGGAEPRVYLSGDTASYRDMRNLRRRDFRIVAGAATFLIFLILLLLIRSVAQSLVLVGATLLTYLATYGATLMVFRAWMGLSGLNWQIDFLLFIIIMSLGQDYNILVATRIREELATHTPEEAVALAVRKTGKVISSCGLIMAATFASLLSASLIVMKQFAVAFALGVLLDTFVVRPVLVPSLILLLCRRRLRRAGRARQAGRADRAS